MLMRMGIDPKAVGKRIVEARAAKDMNRRQFQMAIHGHYQQIMRWEAGEAIPDPSNLDLIQEVTGTSVQYLLYGDPAHAPTPDHEEFIEWLDTMAKDVTPEERAELATMRFTKGRHPGPMFYQVALSVIRAGREAKEAQAAYEETEGHKARARGRSEAPKPGTPVKVRSKKH